MLAERTATMDSTQDDFDPFGLQHEIRGQRVVISVSSHGLPGETEPLSSSLVENDPNYLTNPVDPKRRQLKHGDMLPPPPPQVSRVTRSVPSALPPKLMIKLTLHEEVCSSPKLGEGPEGMSEVSVEGTIFAQVQCSDALRNAPFTLEALCTQPLDFTVRPHAPFAHTFDDSKVVVTIPKRELGYVPVGNYFVKEEVPHMPLLLERKITWQDRSCRIAIQVRSKLSNTSDLDSFTIAVAVPDVIDVGSVEILRGEGLCDELKRTIIWKLRSLKKGESFMVSAEARMWKPLQSNEQINCPVMLRCSSSLDRISSINVKAVEADGYPASISFQILHSFRLLHRLA